MLEDTIRFQSDPAGQVINLGTNRFCKDTFKLLNKNLNFVLTQKTINKDIVSNIIIQIKLGAHCHNNKKISLLKKTDSKNQQVKTGYPP